MARHVHVELDPLSAAALRVLTADGTAIDIAVRRALVAAAEMAEVALDDRDSDTAPEPSREEWIGLHIAAAPPLSAYQRYVLTEAFVRRRDFWLPEAEWVAKCAGEDSAPPQGAIESGEPSEGQRRPDGGSS